jgi:DNA-binding NtrC family response regulator
MAKMVIVATDGFSSEQELTEALRGAGHEVTRVGSLSGVSETAGAADVVFADAQFFADNAAAGTPAAPGDVPVIVTAGSAEQMPAAVDAVRNRGAYDVLQLPAPATEIELASWRALRCQQLMRENAALRAAAGQEPNADPLSSAARNLAGRPLADIEKQVILRTLEQFKGHRLRTAAALGIGVRTLGMKIKRWREEGEPIAGRQQRSHVHVDVS